MEMKQTRKLLSLIIAVVIAISSVCMLSSLTLELSLANKSFFSKHLVTNAVAEECEKQLDLKFEALEAESGIPLSVFQMATKTYSTADNLSQASQNIFSEETAELYSNERVDYFYNLCTEYLDGNNISYNRDDVRRTADKAARIYSETVGIHNTDSISQYLTLFARDCTKATSITIVSLIICGTLLAIIYKKKNYAISYFASGVAGGGIATIIGALLALIFQVGTDVSVSPVVYQSNIVSMIRIYFAYLMLAGIILCSIGSLVNFLIAKYGKREENRQATRFNKIITKL